MTEQNNSQNMFGEEFARELEVELNATRKCLERVDEKLYEYKPHEKSMKMGSLYSITAEVPKWIAHMIEDGEINFQTWPQYKLTTKEDLLRYFEDNVAAAKKALMNTSDKKLEEMFYLKMGDKVLMQSTKKDSVSSTLNHWVHHRGQLTVYMRLNNIPVPSIYGPSADDNTF